jgi:hypothetical protein
MINHAILKNKYYLLFSTSSVIVILFYRLTQSFSLGGINEKKTENNDK